jgi:hypothetical protein
MLVRGKKSLLIRQPDMLYTIFYAQARIISSGGIALTHFLQSLRAENTFSFE